MCKHLTTCPSVSTYLHDRAGSFDDQWTREGSHRNQPRFGPVPQQRPTGVRLSTNESIICPTTQTHYKSDQLSPEAAFRYPWHYDRNAFSAPASRTDPQELRRISEAGNDFPGPPLEVAAPYQREIIPLFQDPLTLPDNDFSYFLQSGFDWDFEMSQAPCPDLTLPVGEMHLDGSALDEEMQQLLHDVGMSGREA
ncbi:hypothetical protein CAC42_1837 [Sphaceloma murrayae]|uniref:Uncharacterized protein n=1 Tax=Sphaceloma murrayae TaxID=2082308 RepID=A0A2K1QVK9_9PEZI|nr:hypothetical protein CAC42_1837 [Sphaceloma murrayae]